MNNKIMISRFIDYLVITQNDCNSIYNLKNNIE